MTDEELIREVQRKWFQAAACGDAAAIVELMTDDVIFLTPGKAPFGRTEFIDSFKLMKERVAISCDGEYTEIIVNGDWACATARLNVTVTPKNGGDSKHLSGYAMSVFRRMPDGKWRLSRDANLLMPQSL